MHSKKSRSVGQGDRQGTEVGRARKQVGKERRRKRHQERKWAGQGNRQGMEVGRARKQAGNGNRLCTI